MNSVYSKLNEGVILINKNGDGIILTKYPFSVRKVKKPGMELLKFCDGLHSLQEILNSTSQPIEKKTAISFLRKLASYNILSVE